MSRRIKHSALFTILLPFLSLLSLLLLPNFAGGGETLLDRLSGRSPGTAGETRKLTDHPDLAKKILPLAKISDAVYSDSGTGKSSSNEANVDYLVAGYVRLASKVEINGFKAALLENLEEPGKYIVVFAGTEDNRDMKANLNISTVPKQYKQALEFTEWAKKYVKKNGGSLELTGHSLGGGLATYAGLKTQTKTTTFNTAPPKPGILRDLAEDQFNDNLVTNIVTEGEFVHGLNLSTLQGTTYTVEGTASGSVSEKIYNTLFDHTITNQIEKIEKVIDDNPDKDEPEEDKPPIVTQNGDGGNDEPEEVEPPIVTQNDDDGIDQPPVEKDEPPIVTQNDGGSADTAGNTNSQPTSPSTKETVWVEDPEKYDFTSETEKWIADNQGQINRDGNQQTRDLLKEVEKPGSGEDDDDNLENLMTKYQPPTGNNKDSEDEKTSSEKSDLVSGFETAPQSGVSGKDDQNKTITGNGPGKEQTEDLAELATEKEKKDQGKFDNLTDAQDKRDEAYKKGWTDAQGGARQDRIEQMKVITDSTKAQQDQDQKALDDQKNQMDKIQSDSNEANEKLVQMQQDFDDKKAIIEQEKLKTITSQPTQPGQGITGNPGSAGVAAGSGISGKWAGTWVLNSPPSCSGKRGKWSGSFFESGGGRVTASINFGFGMFTIPGTVSPSGSFNFNNSEGSIRGSVDGLSISGVANDRTETFCSDSGAQANFMGDKN